MTPRLCILVSLLSFSASTYAFGVCPPYGPVFPKPASLRTDIKNAFASLQDSLDSGLATGNSSHGPVQATASFAAQIFSIEDSGLLFEYYHSGYSLSNQTGVKKVDGDSVFRIGSTSKLVTIYTLLTEIGDGYWNEPVAKYIPELQKKDESNSKKDPVRFTKWDEITFGALAGQVAGVTRDLFAIKPFVQMTDKGFPALAKSELQPCAVGANCSRNDFFESLDTRHPVYLPNSGPIYSDTAFMLLAFALESISGKSYKDLLQSHLIDPLKLTNTYYSAPEESKGVIPVDPMSSYWAIPFSVATPMGGLYMSLNDLTTLGRSVLNSTLLQPNITRSWLTPSAFTQHAGGFVGKPWEIYRAPQAGPHNRIIDIYAKTGDVGMYHTILALIPDLDIGFAVSVAGPVGHHTWIDGLISDIIIPAAENAAREQAEETFGGHYTSTKDGLNSSITFTSTSGVPGLGIESFTSNGTDMLAIFAQQYKSEITAENVRVYPTNLETGKGDEIETTWRMVIQAKPTFEDFGAFVNCRTWFVMDQETYGNNAIDELIFTVGKDGKAKSVWLSGLKVDLERK